MPVCLAEGKGVHIKMNERKTHIIHAEQFLVLLAKSISWFCEDL